MKNMWDMSFVINHISDKIISDFSDSSQILITKTNIRLVNNKLGHTTAEGIKYHVCACIDQNFWKNCIEYKLLENGLAKQSIKKDKLEDAKKYIIKAIKEIINIDNERRI